MSGGGNEVLHKCQGPASEPGPGSTETPCGAVTRVTAPAAQRIAIGGSMTSQFWVIGNQYEDCNFTRPLAGAVSVEGPYREYAAAHARCAVRSFEMRRIPTIRFTIVTEEEVSEPRV